MIFVVNLTDLKLVFKHLSHKMAKQAPASSTSAFTVSSRHSKLGGCLRRSRRGHQDEVAGKDGREEGVEGEDIIINLV